MTCDAPTTPPHRPHAGATGKAACVAALLDNGASQQVQTALNPTAVTPMLLAAAFGHEDCVRLLTKHNPAGDAPTTRTRHPRTLVAASLSCSCARVRCQRRVASHDGCRSRVAACSGGAVARGRTASCSRRIRQKVQRARCAAAVVGARSRTWHNAQLQRSAPCGSCGGGAQSL